MHQARVKACRKTHTRRVKALKKAALAQPVCDAYLLNKCTALKNPPQALSKLTAGAFSAVKPSDNYIYV